MACKNPSPEFELLHRQTLPGIPSASGMVVTESGIYITGDNTPKLFKLDQNYEPIAEIPVSDPALSGPDGIIPKPDKPDFEALEIITYKGRKNLFLFGSGSKSPQRDVMVQVDPETKQKVHTFSLEKLYDRIRNNHIPEGRELNIEAAAVNGDRLYLFHRGSNLILDYSLNAFFRYIDGNTDYPEPRAFQAELPRINGIEAGFSGATAIPGENKILFTASVEDTPNAIDDGEILGSFTGIVNCAELKDGYRPDTVLLSESTEKEEALKIKVESVAILRQLSPRKIRIALVTDSDNGRGSELLDGILKW
ncbi:hypothetical protein KN811_04980 [Sinomicrobium sp. 2019215]|nr:hypothetical protein [Sinomicrobium weinanense]MBU3122754.1 hypothetical protein [Sinomicrobium weinanense]